MGDIADDMLDGTLCSVCGEWLGIEAGYPMMCPTCEKDANTKQDRREEKLLKRINRKRD